MFRICVVGMVAFWVSGCATMISGTTQEITVKSIPPKSTAFILGAPVGPLAVKFKKGSDMMKTIMRLLSPFASAEELAWLETVDFESFITNLVIDTQKDYAKLPPPSVSREAAEGLKKLDRQQKNAILKFLGFEEIGAPPFTAELKRGDIYAVIGYRRGKKIRIEPVESDINWWILLNVFNLGFGLIVDVYSGAWTDLSPEKVLLDLRADAVPLGGKKR